MKVSHRAKFFEFSFTQSLLFVGFAAILITLYRLLFIQTVVSFPHFVFWDYWCALTPVGTNLDTLFRITFLLAAILILLVVFLAVWKRKKGFMICGSVDLFTVVLLLCYAIQPAMLFTGPYCWHPAGYVGEKAIVDLVGESVSRPLGKRPVYCGWKYTCWVDDEPEVVHTFRATGKFEDEWFAYGRLFEHRSFPRNAALAEMQDTYIEQETRLCLNDARNHLKPRKVFYSPTSNNDPSAWTVSYPYPGERQGAALWVESEVEEFFTFFDNKPPRLAVTKSGDFLPYVHPETGAV